MFTEGAERLWPGASLLVFFGKALCRVSDMTEKKTWYQGEHNHALPAKNSTQEDQAFVLSNKSARL